MRGVTISSARKSLISNPTDELRGGRTAFPIRSRSGILIECCCGLISRRGAALVARCRPRQSSGNEVRIGRGKRPALPPPNMLANGASAIPAGVLSRNQIGSGFPAAFLRANRATSLSPAGGFWRPSRELRRNRDHSPAKKNPPGAAPPAACTMTSSLPSAACVAATARAQSSGWPTSA